MKVLVYYELINTVVAEESYGMKHRWRVVKKCTVHICRSEVQVQKPE